jgi:hypothetical protein
VKTTAISRRATLLPLLFGAWRKSHGAELELRSLEPTAATHSPKELLVLVGRLRSIAAAKDYRALEALMMPEFRVEFDAGKGPAAFRRRWASQSHESPVWPVLERLLQLEGVFQSESLYCCPYVYPRFPLDLDLLKHVVMTKPDGRLLAEPKPDAETLMRVSNGILPLAKPLSPPVDLTSKGFLELELPGFASCYVAAADVYSPAGYRLFFERQKGRWRWISLACATLEYPPDLTRLERVHKKGRL